MKLDLELDSTVDELIEQFHSAPEIVSKAIARSLRKLSRFAERRVLRELARQQNITQKVLKSLGRVRVSLYKPGDRASKHYSLVIWIGALDIPAHYLGKPVPSKTGVRTGRHFWEGAFLMQPVNATHPMVFKRRDDWQHKFQRSKKSGRMMWMGLPLEKKEVAIWHSASDVLRKLEPVLLDRFATLMEQELNYVFNIES
ncbi:hypothetical protein [uncultured Endozoicomonas sp.]|uniref:hypothetical protein n=1 Tax=uncultured Endozoicomonas sp. TaxID=432652 RepID=UPI0026206D5D|nr:hypothetical protein [uncultured Endozoicomonas sp.]